MSLREWYRSRHSSWVAIEWGGHRYTIADFALAIGGISGHLTLEEIHGDKVKAWVVETAIEWMAVGRPPQSLATIAINLQS